MGMCNGRVCVCVCVLSSRAPLIGLEGETDERTGTLFGVDSKRIASCRTGPGELTAKMCWWWSAGLLHYKINRVCTTIPSRRFNFNRSALNF